MTLVINSLEGERRTGGRDRAEASVTPLVAARCPRLFQGKQNDSG